MNNFPIKTIKEGNKITKVCVEDIYKTINKIRSAMNFAYSKISSHLREVNKTIDGVNGSFIVGKGISQPCILDAFDEEIGNNIAFIKAKLNSNIKKYKLLKRIYKEQCKLEKTIYAEMTKLSEYINMDLDGIRKHNPDYLIESEDWW